METIYANRFNLLKTAGIAVISAGLLSLKWLRQGYYGHAIHRLYSYQPDLYSENTKEFIPDLKTYHFLFFDIWREDKISAIESYNLYSVPRITSKYYFYVRPIHPLYLIVNNRSDPDAQKDLQSIFNSSANKETELNTKTESDRNQTLD